MRFIAVIASANAIFLALGSAALAQGEYSVKETRRIAFDYAKCVVARHSAAASEALLANVSNAVLQKRYSALIDGECLVRNTHASARMSFAGDLFRYALADALVSREFVSAPVPDLSEVAPLENRPLPDPPVQPTSKASKADKRRYEQDLRDFDQAKAFRALSEYGECVVRSNAAAAKGLLMTEPETPAETARFDELRPSLGRCLPEGRTLEFGKLVLRGTIALSYYRLVHAAVHQNGQ